MAGALTEALVLAGGFGTRLRAIVSEVPKPMAPVAGKPFLEHLLNGLAAKGLQRVVLSVGHMASSIVDHFGGRFGALSLDYAVETTPLGTGGAIALGLTRCHERAVLVLNGDTWLDLEMPALTAQWQRQAQPAPIIVAREVDDVSRYGSLQIEGGCVRRFVEKGGAGRGFINAGVYLLPRDFLAGRAPPAASTFSSPGTATATAPATAFTPFAIEADLLVGYVLTHRTEAFVSRGEFVDIGVPEDYARAQTMQLGQLE
jgi:D-glycero-alpha-D-manno-heptose 1-phosphate guanylyltransferase